MHKMRMDWFIFTSSQAMSITNAKENCISNDLAIDDDKLFLKHEYLHAFGFDCYQL